MNKQFIPYESALKLKDLGFDEDCLGFHSLLEDNILTLTKHKISDDYHDAILWQQAFEYFIRVGFLSMININYQNLWWFEIYNLRVKGNKEIIPEDEYWFKTYEEARQACLEKLIEIVEQKTN